MPTSTDISIFSYVVFILHSISAQETIFAEEGIDNQYDFREA